MISRSVPLASSALGLSAKLDLVSSDGTEAAPVETKRGRVPGQSRSGPHDTHRVQFMAQGLLLREHGYRVRSWDRLFRRLAHAGGRAVYRRSGSAAPAESDRADARGRCRLTVIPDPLEDSPKCTGCSLAGICLPDETLALRRSARVECRSRPPAVKPRHGDGDEDETMIRRLYPPAPDATPLYVQTQGAYVGKSGESLVVSRRGARS